MGNWIQEIFDGDIYDAGRGYNFSNVIALSNRLSQTEIPDINFRWTDITQNHDKTYRWTNNIQFIAGKYQFNYTTDDGMRFYINNVLVSPASPSTDSWHTQSPTDYTSFYTIPSDGMYNVRVEYFNHKGPGVAHFWWVLVQPAVQPPPPTQTVPPPTETFTPITPPVNLADIVTLSKTSVDRQYVKGTLNVVVDDSFVMTNSSDVVTVAVSIQGIAGVAFTPPTFNLNPKQQQSIVVSFDPKQLEALNEGLYQLSCVVSVTAISIAAPATTPGVFVLPFAPLSIASEVPPTVSTQPITQAVAQPTTITTIQTTTTQTTTPETGNATPVLTPETTLLTPTLIPTMAPTPTELAKLARIART